jgi:hypothetical protein
MSFLKSAAAVFRRNTDTGIPEGVEVASVQAPEGSQAVVQLIATSTVDSDGVAQINTGTVEQSDFIYDGDGRLLTYQENGFLVTISRDPVTNLITGVSKASL